MLLKITCPTTKNVSLMAQSDQWLKYFIFASPKCSSTDNNKLNFWFRISSFPSQGKEYNALNKKFMSSIFLLSDFSTKWTLCSVLQRWHHDVADYYYVGISVGFRKWTEPSRLKTFHQWNLLLASSFWQIRQNIPFPSKYESHQIPVSEQNEISLSSRWLSCEALDCDMGGRELDSGWTNTQGLKITE